MGGCRLQSGGERLLAAGWGAKLWRGLKMGRGALFFIIFFFFTRCKV